ncbi:hypothetical protein ISS03_04310 [Patescibacteria group bacterium]|nr:hypothetical protein [Patescibacteria group bacterium]
MWIKRTGLVDTKPSFIGFARCGKCGRGLVLGIPNYIAELTKSKEKCKRVIRNLELIQRIVGVKSVAIAGQLPSVMNKCGVKLPKNFVNGVRGTVFSVVETISQVFLKHDIQKEKAQIVVIGVGYVGSILIKTLQQMKYSVVGIDIKRTKDGIVLPNEADAVLKNSRVVVVLTPRGSDFVPYMKKINKRAVVIDDTHPKIKVGDLDCGNIFYKVAVGMDGVEFFPKLPGYKKDWVPGCVVEAMSVACTADFTGKDQLLFNKQTSELGFYPHLVN